MINDSNLILFISPAMYPCTFIIYIYILHDRGVIEHGNIDQDLRKKKQGFYMILLSQWELQGPFRTMAI